MSFEKQLKVIVRMLKYTVESNINATTADAIVNECAEALQEIAENDRQRLQNTEKTHTETY
jgi:hypothetical protein